MNNPLFKSIFMSFYLTCDIKIFNLQVMNSQSIILSSSGLKNILINNQDDEFRFIIGNQEIKMPRIFAEFLSPRVSHLHQCDPTINCLNFSDLSSKTKGLSFSTTKFNSIINENTKNTIDQITRGNNFEITNENQQNLLHLSVLLGNDELFKKKFPKI